jgi:hypothetical protein
MVGRAGVSTALNLIILKIIKKRGIDEAKIDILMKYIIVRGSFYFR